MAFTYIVKNSALAGKVPSAAQLQPGELALNLADQKLYSKDAGGTVFEIGKPEELDKGSTSQRPPTPIQGDLYYDTDINTLLYWDGTEWVEIGRVKVDLSYQTNGNSAGTVTNTAGNNATIPVATNSTAGLFTGTEKQKLQGISNGADVANNGRITITKSGVTQGSFTVNQGNDQTIDIPADAASGVTSITAGSNITISPASGTGNVTVSTSNDYNDLINVPTIGDATIVINQGGTEKGRFTLNQTNDVEINLVEGTGGGTGGGFSGDYNDLNNKPTIGNGEVKIFQGGNQKGTFTVNQTGDTVVNLDAAGLTSALTGTEAPLADDGSKARLEYSKGLHVVNNKLETYLGTGLAFDGDKMKVEFPPDSVVSYVGQSKVTGGSDEVKYSGAGIDSPGGKKDIRFDNIPTDVDGFITITTFRCELRINDSTDYPTPLAVARMVGDFYCEVSGRNATCRTSNTSNSIGLILGSTIAFGGGPGSANTAWRHYLYGTRVDEWTCNTGSDGIRFNFGARNIDHNKIKLVYNGGCRVALLPYDK